MIDAEVAYVLGHAFVILWGVVILVKLIKEDREN